MTASAAPPLPALYGLERLDVAAGRRLAAGRQRPAVQVAAKVGKLGDQEPLYLLSALILTTGVATRRPGLMRLGIEVGAAVFAADLIKSGFKRGLTRSRPHVLLDEGRYERGFGGSSDKPLQSFPSGHVAGAMAAAAAIRRTSPQTAPLGLAACAFLGWSRISKAAHWPLDVLAGALVGLAAEAATAGLGWAVDRLRRRAGTVHQSAPP